VERNPPHFYEIDPKKEIDEALIGHSSQIDFFKR